jgi:hypothetical protein
MANSMPSMPLKPVPVALRIELREVTPLVWRRVVVPNHAALDRRRVRSPGL